MYIYIFIYSSLSALYSCYAVQIFILDLFLFFSSIVLFFLRRQRHIRNANGCTVTWWIIAVLKGEVTVENTLSALNVIRYKKWHKSKGIARQRVRATDR